MPGPGAKPRNGSVEIGLISPVDRETTGPLQMFSTQGDDPPGHTPCDSAPPVYFRGTGEDDRSQPRPVVFLWQAAPDGLDGWKYDLSVRAADGSGEKHILRGLTQPAARVENLRVGTLYAWEVRARVGRSVVGRSGTAEFRTHPQTPRWIHVEGVTNLRDLGGWPLPGDRRVRQGLFFRGSEMNSHCQITPAGRKVLVEQLGIRTDIDLRGIGEERQAVLDPQQVTYINIPLASYDMIASPEYTRAYRALFGLFARRENYPLYLHCWGGADRTGTAAFLVGALLGMRMEDLVKDYELTSLSVWGERRSDGEPFCEMLQILELFAPRGSSLQTQAEGYLRVIGVSDEEVAAIREILTEPWELENSAA